jgi:hypothetical protein
VRVVECASGPVRDDRGLAVRGDRKRDARGVQGEAVGRGCARDDEERRHERDEEPERLHACFYRVRAVFKASGDSPGL